MKEGTPRSFSALRDKISRRKIAIPPPLTHKLFHTRNFLKHRRFPLPRFSFRSSETDKFQRNRHAPLLCMKNFDTKIFSKHRRVSLRILSALKQFSTENTDILFLCIKFFRYPKFSDSLKHRWVTLRSYSVRSCERKFSTKPLHPPPPIPPYP